MTERVKDSERVRKAYSARGERGQIRISFRLDNENVEFLNQQPNKGRFINNLIAAARGQ